MKFLPRAMVAAAFVSLAAPPSARADMLDLGTVGSSQVLIAATTGTMTITFLHARAALTNSLVLFASTSGQTASPTGGTLYANPLIAVPGNFPSVGVGSPHAITINVTAGQTLLFGICTSGKSGSTNSACTSLGGGKTAYYMGQGSNNNDGMLHAVILSPSAWNAAATGCLAETPPCFLAAAGTTVVGFEDLPNLGDADFDDLVFSFTNTTTTTPEPGTMGLLALGLAGLSSAGLLRRRSARRNK